MKRIFQMHLTEAKLDSLRRSNGDFVKDYKKCKGRFYIHEERGVGINTLYVERTYASDLYWVVTRKNGTIIEVPIEVNLDEGLFEI